MSEKRLPVNEDPKVVAYKWSNQVKDGKAIVAKAMQAGVLGKKEGYDAQKVNAGLASGELIGFVNVIDTEKGRTILEVIQKSTSSAKLDDVL